MSFPFNPAGRYILVQAELIGPTGQWQLRLALDTAASRTVINPGLLVTAGYPASSPNLVPMTTASGQSSAPAVTVRELKALGHTRVALSVLAHALPQSASIDGLLGLDFFRGLELTIDFRNGLIDLQ